jgi:hypothetical protein
MPIPEPPGAASRILSEQQELLPAYIDVCRHLRRDPAPERPSFCRFWRTRGISLNFGGKVFGGKGRRNFCAFTGYLLLGVQFPALRWPRTFGYRRAPATYRLRVNSAVCRGGRHHRV